MRRPGTRARRRAVRIVQEVRRVLDHLDAEVPTSRVDLAADRLGSSHALDPGTRLEAAATRALAHRPRPADTRDLRERAGAHLDLTSGPALVWRLQLRGASACSRSPRKRQSWACPSTSPSLRSGATRPPSSLAR